MEKPQKEETPLTGDAGILKQAGVVYELSCILCKSRGCKVAYIGETGRMLATRINEHLSKARNFNTAAACSPVFEHFLTCHGRIPKMAVISFAILKVALEERTRRIYESQFIHDNKPVLNKNSGVLLCYNKRPRRS